MKKKFNKKKLAYLRWHLSHKCRSNKVLYYIFYHKNFDIIYMTFIFHPGAIRLVVLDRGGNTKGMRIVMGRLHM